VLSSDLRTALGMFRHRITPWLEQNGLFVDWQVQIPAVGGYSPRETLHLFRIMHEACSNIVKHSGANHVAVNAHIDMPTGRLHLTIADNGRGGVIEMTALVDSFGAHRGVNNMKQRAKELGGTLEIDSTPRGTTVILDVPAPGAPAAATPDSTTSESSPPAPPRTPLASAS
jgi:signal transduction histidine kinase